MACCSVQTPITALLAFDVASGDWRSVLSVRFVMDANADQCRFELHELESLVSWGGINLARSLRSTARMSQTQVCVVYNCTQDGVAAVRSGSCSIDEARRGYRAGIPFITRICKGG